jgi:hypothetical protein
MLRGTDGALAVARARGGPAGSLQQIITPAGPVFKAGRGPQLRTRRGQRCAPVPLPSLLDAGPCIP